ncbi:MAG: ABC transporter ATP-binding protein [Candidatus Magasanikbacteria bacterium]|nr:ABC transporter ATP-binding protein [Candidatus Magasanikbacteria bacterium]
MKIASQTFSFRRIFGYIWPQMRKYRWHMILLLVIFTIRISNDIIRPIFLRKIVDILSVSELHRADVAKAVMFFVIIIIILNGAAGVLGRISKHLHLSFEIKVIEQLRNFAFRKIQDHSQTFFSNTFAGSLVTKSRRFVGAFEVMFDVFIYNFWNVLVVLTGAYIVLAQESLLIAGVLFAWMIIHIVSVTYFVKYKVRFDLEEARYDSKIGGRLADVFGNNIAVKTFSAGEREISLFAKLVNIASEKMRKSWFFGNKVDIVQAVLIFLAQGVMLYVMIKLWIAGTISTGVVVLAQTYMVIIFDRMWDLGNSLTKFMKSAADMQEMIDIFEVPLDIKDPVTPEALRMNEGHVVFNDVGFNYPNGKKVFSNFQLDIKPGERIGLVGQSGAGKSTITKLLLRFTDVTSGAITIDNQDIRNVTQDDLRRTVSYVPQEPVLFHRSLADNIAYGKPEATLEEIREAARRANADDFISELEHGYDTYVGERGVKLSGGERQRIAIARAILKDAPVLVLDEATSSLDSHSENLIQAAFAELMKGKTTIVIAHRLSTIQKMDRIVVLHLGSIAEEGTHDELLKKQNGVYKGMWDLQAGGFIGTVDRPLDDETPEFESTAKPTIAHDESL